MYYASIGFLASLILVIINKDILIQRKEKTAVPAQSAYRRFLLFILIYHLTDILWGVLDEFKLVTLLYADTVIYFIAMATVLFFWAQYVFEYIEEKNIFKTAFYYFGIVFIVFQLVILIINFFRPIMFWFDEEGGYHEEFARNLTLYIQIFLFLLSFVYTLVVSIRSNGADKRRHLTISLFSLSMAVFVLLQMFYPLLPLYSVGLLIGICLIHTFVIEDEKEENHNKLQEVLKREKQQRKELGETRELAFTDSLTKVKSIIAYMEKEKEIDDRINDGTLSDIAVAVFDLNGLKRINDTMGHEMGNQYIIDASRVICNHFKHSPVYRVGGDEFVAILEGEDFVNRTEIVSAFDKLMDENLKNDKLVVSLGMADYIPEKDQSFRPIFERADIQMYNRKNKLKEIVSD
ncbi:MAG: GGDEF domain-containing protein [Clostridia bacterium]|nr:GGDEF domain-containing protein [Clostridia bacterium]